ncbi:hypothetical protein SIN8267_00755 [Sinobacterium norvegicum]|uniref:Patatin-like phospholipase family protein n=1 Tax=Sinobacterium norvegicum TaxID=1641715 RepID=A0ABM9ABS7_9GAMM|nr:hypothetical protein [Sinobacterium norvegicum]CAH0990661.1 hypothetical protein SIN8267_00755 [Sinobacterium norvegicum]
MSAIKILAGHKAYRHIQQNGLSANDIAAVFGASGAAKWLTIYGLDRAVFDRFLATASHPIDLFGTSVGAFKLAACAQDNPGDALLALANAYIGQDYVGKETSEQVVIETKKILDAFLSPQAVSEILTSSRFNYQCGAVLTQANLASPSLTRQKLAMVKGFGQSLLGKQWQQNLFERVIFHAPQAAHSFDGYDGYPTQRLPLSTTNFRQAILSSGSIPVVMPGVDAITDAPAGMYRDGGLLDYHAVPSNVSKIDHGLVLYPHFYSYLKEGWFDKFWPWRRVSAAQLDNTVLIAPSESFVASLPGGRIPERQDFYRFRHDDNERVRRWTQVRDQSLVLGEEFLAAVQTGDIARLVQPI